MAIHSPWMVIASKPSSSHSSPHPTHSLPARSLPTRIDPTRNPKFAEHVNVPLSALWGLFRCSASPNCRAKHRNVPLGAVQKVLRCSANFGLGQET